MTDSTYKYLKSKKWYHGTTLSSWKELCEKGIRSDYNKGNELDFGYGFYLTPVQKQAEYFISKILEVTGKTDVLSEMEEVLSDVGIEKKERSLDFAIVIEFDFIPLDWVDFPNCDNFRVFGKYDDDFAKYVFYNRVENSDGLNHNPYDFEIGVMSDSNPIIDVERYKNGEIGKDEVIESFKKSTSNKQICIHSQDICDILRPSRAYIISTGEELNINEYINYGKRKPINETVV